MQSTSMTFVARLLLLIVRARSVPIESGDTIFLKSGSGFGNHVEVETHLVQARWQQRAGWQALAIEKAGGGAINSGDTVFLKTHSGSFIDVEGDAVQARFAEQGTWQGLVIDKPEGGAISPGDVVCLLAHTGKHIDVEGASVQARWHDCGAWQRLMMQKEMPTALPVGATVFLKTFSGTYIDVEAGAVQARWGERGTWQEFVIESNSGASIFTGDVIYLKAHTGRHIHVDGASVQALWEDRGSWQALTVEKSVAGPILPGDAVFLRSHTGKHIDAQGDGTVQARWSDHGAWQSFVVELKAAASTSTFLSPTTRTTTPSVPTTMPTTEPPQETTLAPTPAPTLPPIAVVEAAAAQIINLISASENAGDALGGIVRLAFHDAGSWDGSTGGADGCVDLASPENAGLDAVIAQLASVVSSVGDSLSRADVWALAGNVAVEVAGGPAMEFEVGRRDADSCEGHGVRLPSAELRQDHIRDVFLTRYGFNERETTALMGAHVLGRAEASFSGYTGAWVPRNDRFSNAYFRDLLARPWIKRSFPSGTNTLTQWDGPPGTATMMLNTDLELAFDTSSSSCSIAGGNRQPPRGTTACPRATHAFNDAVTEFADAQTGQAAWHAAFAPAFKRLTSLGAGSLQCALPDCSTPGPRIRR